MRLWTLLFGAPTLAFPALPDLSSLPHNGSTALLGDLATIPVRARSGVGHAIAEILTGAPALVGTLTPYTPPSKDSPLCQKDTCCIWAHIVHDDIVPAFRDDQGECNGLARAALRLGFHDAAAWKSGLDYGGADGSILLSPDELARPVNRGLEGIAAVIQGWHKKYTDAGWNVGMADLIQVAAVAGFSSCRMGFNIITLVGRPDNVVAGPDGLTPDETAQPDELIALFADKTLDSYDLVAVVGAHTIAQQFFVNERRRGAALDSTPHVFDTRFYTEVRDGDAPFILESDRRMVSYEDPADVNGGTKGSWDAFSVPGAGLPIWQSAFSRGYFRLSLLGVPNLNELVDCTKVMPKRV